MEQPNETVAAACCNLLMNLDCDEFYDHPYTLPFMKYVSSWKHAIPIRAIIIGQNPYPQNIYPEYGAALSYDPSKCRSVPGSVKVIAEDLYNTHEVNKEDTIECFQNIWRMTERGVIAINETVFARIVDSEKNSSLRPIRESELQIRALQVLISESYAAGQTCIECIGMGMNAAMMTNLIRQWCPNDIMSLKTITCTNPAALARNLGDISSHPVTFGNAAVSKLLHSIVKDYVSMPAKRDDKRTQQNIDAFVVSTENVAVTSLSVRKEYSSFIERMKTARKLPEAESTLNDLGDVLGSLVGAIENHTSTLRAQAMSFVMASESITAQRSRNDSAAQSQTTIQSFQKPYAVPVQSVVTAPPVTPSRRTTRRVVRASSEMGSPQVPTIKEGVVADYTSGSTPTSAIEPTVAHSVVSRRRTIRRGSSIASSVAGTEYTAASAASRVPASIPVVGTAINISSVEAVHMKSIGRWVSSSMENDTTFSQMIEVTTMDNIVASEFAREVLAYVRQRMSQFVGYDAYDELEQESSETLTWCKNYIDMMQQ